MHHWKTERIKRIACLGLLVLSIALWGYEHFLSSGEESKEPAQFPVATESSIGDREDPEARVRFDWMRLRDPATGRIPANVRAKELSFAASLPTKESLVLSKRKRSDGVAGAQLISWSGRGPFNLGGRTRALGIDVTNANTILAGSVSGGMWRSTDGGESWTKTSSAASLHSVSCIAGDTRSGKTNIWYYGTGEYIGNSSSGGGAPYRGDGIFKSTDGGASWTLLPSTSTSKPHLFDQLFDYVWNLATDPSNVAEDEVYAATYGAIWRSSNGGTTWSITLGGSSPYSAYTDVKVTSSGVVYSAGSSGSSMSGIRRSTDGITWTNILPAGFPTVYSRIVIGVAPSNENVVYFLVQGTNGTNGVDQVNSHQLWKYTYISGDGSGPGGSWVNRGSNLPSESGLSGNAVFDTQGGYDMLVAVKPDDEDFVIVGGTNLYRSTDGFATNANWARIGGYAIPTSYDWYTNHHPDQHAGAFPPGSNLIFYSAHDEGVSRTSDITASSVSWTSLNNGYMTTQFYTLALDHGTGGNDIIIGGMQDNGTWFTNSSSSSSPWKSIFSGDGAFCAIANGRKSYYASSQNGRLYRFLLDDYGNPSSSPYFTRVDPTGGSGYLFINPFMLDPNNTNLMYLAGGDTLWRNTDIPGIPLGSNSTTSVNWTVLPNPAVIGNTISALGVSKSNPANRLYYGTSDGKIYRIDGAHVGTPSSTDVWTGKGLPPSAYVSCLAVDPLNGDNVLLVFSNYGVVSLYYTSDGGTTWTAVASNLEQFPDGTGNGPSCRWAAILPGTGTTYYFVGTSTGLYSTETLNGSSTVWAQEGASTIGNVVVDMVATRFSDGLVAVGTHGQGVFTGTVSSPLPIQLASFTAAVIRDNDVEITWQTVTELNNYGFEIHRKRGENSDWRHIAFIEGNGTTLSPHSYAYVDRSVPFGRYYYRIRQIDLDGRSETFPEMEINVGVAHENLFLAQNYPNPFNPTSIIEFTVPKDGFASMKLYDLQGRQVATLFEGDALAGRIYEVRVNAHNLASGMYFYRLSSAERVMTKRMIVLK